jgi:GxxExxY protein
MDRIERMKHREITSKILECSFEVINELGTGFLESVYENAMVVALAQKGLSVDSQVALKVKFRGVIVGEYYADIIVDNKVLVELKAVSKIAPDHKAQIINYLNATGIDVGLLLNFGNSKLEYFRFFRKDPENPVHPV